MGFHLFSGLIFQRAGTTAEKAAILNPTSWNSFNWWDLQHTLPAGSGGTGQCDWDETVPQVPRSHAIKDFKGDNQDVKLNPEANWHPMQLLRQRCNMHNSRGTQNCLHCSLYPSVTYKYSSRIAPGRVHCRKGCNWCTTLSCTTPYLSMYMCLLPTMCLSIYIWTGKHRVGCLLYCVLYSLSHDQNSGLDWSSVTHSLAFPIEEK